MSTSSEGLVTRHGAAPRPAAPARTGGAAPATPGGFNVLGRRTPRHASLADRAHCRRLIREGSKTFSAASKLLPADKREAAWALYAFCRVADDAVDLGHDGLATLHALEDRLEAIYADRPGEDPVDRAFADAVRDHGLPKTPMTALLEGMAWDITGRHYRTLSDVLAYSARVAATVGVMMTVLMHRRSPEVIARAIDLGLAMQLTNIARDVGEDARNGRLYLPSDWLREEGVDPDGFLAAPARSPGLVRTVRRLLDVAEGLYARSEEGIAVLPRPCRPAIFGARLMYAEIGRRIAEGECDPVTERSVVPLQRKLALMTRSAGLAARARPSGAEPAPAVPEAQFLIDATVAEASWEAPVVTPAPWRIDERIGRVVLLMDGLSSRRRTKGGPDRI